MFAHAVGHGRGHARSIAPRKRSAHSVRRQRCIRVHRRAVRATDAGDQTRAMRRIERCRACAATRRAVARVSRSLAAAAHRAAVAVHARGSARRAPRCDRRAAMRLAPRISRILPSSSLRRGNQAVAFFGLDADRVFAVEDADVDRFAVAHVCCSSDFSRAIIASTRERACSFFASNCERSLASCSCCCAQAAVFFAEQVLQALDQRIDAGGDGAQLGEGVGVVHAGTIGSAPAGGSRRDGGATLTADRGGGRRAPVADEGEAAVRVQRRRQPVALDLVAAVLAQELAAAPASPRLRRPRSGRASAPSR